MSVNSSAEKKMLVNG